MCYYTVYVGIKKWVFLWEPLVGLNMPCWTISYVTGIHSGYFGVFVKVGLCQVNEQGNELLRTKIRSNTIVPMQHINHGFSPASPGFLHQPLLSHYLLLCNHPSTQLSSYRSLYCVQPIIPTQARFHSHYICLRLPTYSNEWYTLLVKYFLPFLVVCSLHFPYTCSLVIK
jgi:hypothetical protein